ncbi:MAG: pilus assembly protein [Xanthobacteraceae bacterium]|nr:pilus assembly protein [Xanthobacteraceae bacterium]MBX9829849.1 pilus assembly protein [Xanthobacteraceae bacterium]
MKNFSFLTRLSHRITSLRRDQRGVSAVEFAMVLPLMLTLYLGAVEISQGVAIHRKVTLTARTVADLGSQVTSINNADMANVLKAAEAVIAPFAPGQLKVTVSAVNIDANGIAKVAWSDTLNGTARAVNSTVSLPTALNVPNSQLIWSEVHYFYTPTIGYVVTGSLNLFDEIYMRPRLSETVARTS